MARSCWKPKFDILINKLKNTNFIDKTKRINVYALKNIRQACILPRHINLVLPTNLQKGKLYTGFVTIKSKMVGLKFGMLTTTKRIVKPKIKKKQKKKK